MPSLDRHDDAESALRQLFASGDEAPGAGAIDWEAEKDAFEAVAESDP